MKHLFIINPKAGVKDQSQILSQEIEALKDKIDYTIYITKGYGDDKVFVKDYLMNHPNEEVTIYACGGDGTLYGVINGAFGHQNARITCVPIGSGNDFLKYYGEASKFRRIENLIDGEAKTIDLLRLNNQYIANVFNMGFDSKVVVKQANIKKWPLMTGKGAYNLGVFFSLLGKMGYKCKLTIDDELVYNGKMTLCAIANAKCYGGGYYCCPKAKTDDGLLDVCFVKKVSRITFAKLVGSYKAGTHLENPKIQKYLIYRQGKKVNLEIEKTLPYSADGEIGYSNNVSLELIPQAIQFVIPKE